MNRWICVVLVFFCGGGTWEERLTASQVRNDVASDGQFFETQIRPILEAHCWKCHGGDKTRGGLDLTHRAGLLAGGDLGPSVDLAEPAKSLLVEAINYQDLEMPPTGQLPEASIALLTEWVARGLPWPEADQASPPRHEVDEEPYISDEDRAHWAYQPLIRPRPPAGTDAWGRNPIDRFVARRRAEKGLAPNPPAPRRALIRRLYYDLIGLPPTPADIEQFVNDRRDDAYERLVDQLLASPEYGEHWARHWLDLVRYAETNSFERDNAKPNVWRYRDYVIAAWNHDKPYDQFLVEQLAGDEVDHVTNESMIATGYYRLGLWDDEPTDAIQAYFDHLDDVISVTSQVVMGMTINCARCHEHKIDPIPQEDYYRFLAYFRNIYQDTETEGERAFKKPFTLNTQTVIASDEERREFDSYLARFQKELSSHREELERLEELIVDQFSAPEREDAADPQIRRRLIDEKQAVVLTEAQRRRLEEVRRELEKKLPQPNFPQALVVRGKRQRAGGDTFSYTR